MCPTAANRSVEDAADSHTASTLETVARHVPAALRYVCENYQRLNGAAMVRKTAADLSRQPFSNFFAWCATIANFIDLLQSKVRPGKWRSRSFLPIFPPRAYVASKKNCSIYYFYTRMRQALPIFTSTSRTQSTE
jgi:hypothetical protein